MPASVDPVAITVGDGGARVSGLLMRPSDARWLYLLAHGAGAGMRHPFLETIARALAERGVATLRYQFPYMERRARPPPPPPRAAGPGPAPRGPRGPPPPRRRLPGRGGRGF